MATKRKKRWTSSSVVKEFGPVKRIDRYREADLLIEGKWKHILTVLESDGRFEAVVGHHLVNMHEIYETSKEMPEDLVIKHKDVWFGEEDLPNG